MCLAICSRVAADGTDASEMGFGGFSGDVSCVSPLAISGSFRLYGYFFLARGTGSFSPMLFWELGGKYLGD